MTSGRPRPRPCPSRCRSRSRSFFSFLTVTSSLGLGRRGQIYPTAPPSAPWLPLRARSARQTGPGKAGKCLRCHLLFLDLPADYVGGEGFLRARADKSRHEGESRRNRAGGGAAGRARGSRRVPKRFPKRPAPPGVPHPCHVPKRSPKCCVPPRVPCPQKVPKVLCAPGGVLSPKCPKRSPNCCAPLRVCHPQKVP